MIRRLLARLESDYTSRQLRRRALILGAVAFAVMLVVFSKFSLTKYYPPMRGATVPLAGLWEISYDHEQWCPVAVPNPFQGQVPKTAGCPENRYPRELMLGKTFWYRKRLSVTEPLAEPALFLGAIKNEAWIYWDGQKLSHQRDEAPTVVVIDPELAKVGAHEIRVQVRADEATANPGLYHAAPQSMMLAEFPTTLAAFNRRALGNDLEPYGVAVVQIAALLLLMFFVVRSTDIQSSSFWLLFHFASSAVYAVTNLSSTKSWSLFLSSGSHICMSVALTGYALSMLGGSWPSRALLERAVFAIAPLTFLIQVVALLLQPGLEHDLIIRTYQGVIIVCLMATAALSIVAFGRRKASIEPDKLLNRWPNRLLLAALFCGRCVYFVQEVLFPATFWHGPLVSSILTIVVLALAVDAQIGNERRLAFYARFIADGLRSLYDQALLAGDRNHAYGVYRPRRIGIAKVDLCGSTKAFGSMPHGPKREFIQLYYQKIESIVLRHIFSKKGDGDGFIYYFKEGPAQKDLTPAWDCVRRIHLQALNEFFEEFKNRFRQLSREASSDARFQKALGDYLETFRVNQGVDFYENRLQMKSVIVYGTVDEGLWGTRENPHYDVQGSLLILVARLEKLAKPGEVLFSVPAYEKLLHEDPTALNDVDVERRQATLDLGPVEYVVARFKTAVSLIEETAA